MKKDDECEETKTITIGEEAIQIARKRFAVKKQECKDTTIPIEEESNIARKTFAVKHRNAKKRKRFQSARERRRLLGRDAS